MKVFFYGLFMDVDVLAKQGVVPESVSMGWIDDFVIRISQRATLVREAGGRAYGVLMDVNSSDIERLYAEESVADYVAETVCVNTEGSGQVEAACYNLPHEKIVGENREYAKLLLKLVRRLSFPKAYTEQILRASR